jgi:class 3 adenylate cyclase
MKEETERAGLAETRKLAAIMFTDIVGFSRQSERLGGGLLFNCSFTPSLQDQ